MSKVNIYIDGNNLYRAAKELGFEIDYKKLRGWLDQKYKPQFVYLFIGLVPERAKFYEHLQNVVTFWFLNKQYLLEKKLKEIVMLSWF